MRRPESSAVREAIAEIVDRIRPNTLETRRRKLGLSRAALARILEVDPSSVFRNERSDPMNTLWDYALRGVEAEAASLHTRSELRAHTSTVHDRDIIPAITDAHGHKLLAEKMRAMDRKPPKPRTKKSISSSPPQDDRAHHPPKGRTLPKSAVDAAVDRAIARSAANKRGAWR